MAVSAYVGQPGSGKTYALVAQVVVPAFIAGRRIVSNIEGLTHDNLATAYPDATGQLVQFHGSQALQLGFWPNPDAPSDEIAPPSFVQGGDIVVFDELSLYVPATGKVYEPFLKYLRFHRHFTNDQGLSSDVVVCTQAVTAINLQIRHVLQNTYKFKKLTALGANNTYAWSLYEGHRTADQYYLNGGNGKYRQEIYSLYKSYSNGSGKETATDTRSNVLKSWRFYAFIVAIPLCIIAGAYGVSKVLDVDAPDTAKRGAETMTTPKNYASPPAIGTGGEDELGGLERYSRAGGSPPNSSYPRAPESDGSAQQAPIGSVQLPGFFGQLQLSATGRSFIVAPGRGSQSDVPDNLR